MHDLLIVYCFAKGPSFYELAKIIGLCKFVNKADAFCSFTIGFKLFEMKKITRVRVVWNTTIRVQSWVLQVFLVVSQYTLHKL